MDAAGASDASTAREVNRAPARNLRRTLRRVNRSNVLDKRSITGTYIWRAPALQNRRAGLRPQHEAKRMREQFNQALKDAMKSGDKRRVSTIRLVTAALKDRDIEQRGLGKDPLSDEEILGLLQKMVKQRQESLRFTKPTPGPSSRTRSARRSPSSWASCPSRWTRPP